MADVIISGIIILSYFLKYRAFSAIARALAVTTTYMGMTAELPSIG